jgi:hypothetical protein
MAQFDPVPQEVSPVNYASSSQGYQTSPNTALGDLFGNLAETIDAGVQVADQSVQTSIKEDVYAQTDAIKDEFGVSDATLFEADAEGSGPLPPQLEQAGSNIARLQNAYNKGALRESHYWARLNSMVRQLRQKYPGYRDQIDDMVSSTVGGQPANQLRAALFQEFNDTAGQATKDYNDFVERAGFQGLLPPDFFQRQNAGNPYGMTEVQAYVFNRTARSAAISEEKAILELSAQQDNVNVKEVGRVFSEEASQSVWNILEDTTNALGSRYDQISERLRAYQENPRLVEQEGGQEGLAWLRTEIGSLEQGLRMELLKTSTNPWGTDAANTYASYLEPEELNQRVEQAMMPLTLLKNAINDENFGMINALTAQIEATKTQAQAKLLADVPGVAYLKALQDLANPTAVDKYLMLNPQIGNAVSAALLDTVSAQAAIGEGSVVSAMELGEAKNQSADFYNGLIKRWENIADQIGTDLPPEMVAQNVRFMFSDDASVVFSKMSPDDKWSYYTRVSSPQVTKKMLELKAMGDTQSWNTYQTWTSRAFVGLFREELLTLGNMNQDVNSPYTVTWNDRIKGFELYSPGFLFGDVTVPMTRINSAIQVISPIIEADGKEVGEDLYTFLTEVGFRPEGGNRGGVPWTPVGMGRAFAGALEMFQPKEASE